MKIKEIKFLKSVTINDDRVFFENRDEIVFVGRSNMGKSTLMNKLFNKKDMVKTSARPGKTKTANIFVVNKKFYYTDLPGYGFARLGKEVREHLDALISWYLEERRNNIKKVVMLIDSKIGPQESDIEMFGYIQEMGLPVTIVLSKIDRLSKGEVDKSLAATRKQFFGQQVVAVSSTKNKGIDELGKIFREALLGN
ncbi:ribosome biogenesis GTP-binding protein YihA/YsxC [Candidatus Gracilibacteria bacterium]|nr:ribosome biogenesis GTP-binding protein YihA/YsxC [Candidatus Gracilibacteria bacterium]